MGYALLFIKPRQLSSKKNYYKRLIFIFKYAILIEPNNYYTLIRSMGIFILIDISFFIYVLNLVKMQIPFT